MPNNNTTGTRAITGMFRNLHPMQMGDGMYDYALNARIDNFDGTGIPVIQNEGSNILCAGSPTDMFVIGFVNIIEQNRILWFYTDDDGASEIGETMDMENCRKYAKDNLVKGSCDDCGSMQVSEKMPLENITQVPCCTYRTLATDTCLNFSRKYPINSTAYRITECGIEIFFTDNNNERRHLEFEYIDDDSTKGLKIKQSYYEISGYETPPCETPIYSENLDCNKLKLQPDVTTPCIDFVDLVPGGSNKAGVYQFFIAYCDIKANKLSSYMSSTNPIPISTKYVTFETDYLTDRAIKLKIENINIFNPYSYYKIAVGKTINATTSFYEVGVFPITQQTVVYTGNDESEKKLTIGDIYQRYPYYKTAESVTSSNDILFWASLKEFPKLNLQRVANNIKLQWQTIAIPESVYRNPRNANKFRSCMRDEVYPYGIMFLFDNSEESPVFHLPGRASISTDLEIVDNNDVIRENNCDDCLGEEEEGLLPDDPVELEELNENNCSGGGDDEIELTLDNSHQASSCPLTTHTDSGLSPVTVTTPAFVNAGADQSINYLATVPLNGTVVMGSSPIVSTTWTQLSGPNTVTINNAGLVNTYFENYNAGTYVFQLAVQDVDGNTSVDNVQYTVTIPVNLAPIANPGSDKIVTLPIDYSFLNGASSSDIEGVSSFLWTQDSGPNTATIVSPTLPYTDVTGLIEGTYVFRLAVTDTRGCVSEATTIIYVLADPSTEIPVCSMLLYPINGSTTSSYTTVTLDWTDVSNATSYDVYLRTDAGIFALVGNTVVSTYVLSPLLPNTIYHWYIVPKNDAGENAGCEYCYRSFVTPVTAPTANCEKKRWEVYNTATVEGGALEVYDECNETCYQYGDFAYWESTERYPNIPLVWGDLCGMPIRHHKYPDSLITHIHDNKDGSLDYSKNNILYPIGVKVDVQSVRDALAHAITDDLISAEDASRIVGYRILRGNRFQNKSVIAKGMLYDMNQYRRKLNGGYFDNEDVYFANYPYNDLSDNPFVTDDFANYDTHNKEKGSDLPFIFSKRYTFHSPDTHFNEPAIGTKLKLETVEYGQSEGYFTKAKKQAKQRFLSDTSYAIAFSMGIMAALLKTEEKEIKEYTVKGSVISGMGVASGIFGPYLPYQTGTGAAIIPESILDTLVNLQKSASINAATEVTTRTVQGKYKDYINPIFLAVKKPLLLPLYPLILLNYASGFLTTVIEEANIIIKLIESLTPFRDWTLQYHSAGKYNAYKTIANSGNKIRTILSSEYLSSQNTTVNEYLETDPTNFTSIKINNWRREGSVYLKYSGANLPNAGTASGIVDTSRFSFEDGSVSETLDKRVYKDISSYYASIKNFVPDQYGTIYNIEYLPTDSCSFALDADVDDCRTVFGGDTFINRFGLKIKVPYFLADTFMLPPGTDFNFTDYPNLAVPRHYYDSTLGLGSEFNDIGDMLSLLTPKGIATFLGRPKSIRDASTNKFFYQNGYIYLYHYGIPYFLVESDINVDYRYAENSKEKDFYPHNRDLDNWLQEENVSIREDNYYFYNNAYSKQNHETPFTINPAEFEPNRDCRVEHPNRIIYATDNNWLVYKANDLINFPLSKGKITSIEGIENKTVLVRTINSTSIFKSILTTQVNGQTVQVGNGGLFSNPPQEFAETTLGYVGSQHKAIEHTEFGHVWADAKRGEVFNLGAGANSLDEISKDGMKDWFKENLPFQILRDFPNMPFEVIDNNFLGLGICMAFDKRSSRLLLTKRDYKVINKDVAYDADSNKFLFDGDEVKLTDKKYFRDKSWTISYNFLTKTWVSFHSYKPNYYLDFVSFFGSGVDKGFWLHDIINSSNQVFYGKLEPFTFEPIIKFSAGLKVLNSIEFDTEVRRYNNEFDYTIKKTIPGINKLIIYNDQYNSGLLNLIFSDKNKLSETGKYPVKGIISWDVETSLSNYKWRVNQFYNLVKDHSELPLWKYQGNNADKDLNNMAFNYKKNDFTLARLKGQWFKLRMTNDKLSNYKIIHKLVLDNQTSIFK